MSDGAGGAEGAMAMAITRGSDEERGGDRNAGNIRVCLRVRPLNEKERKRGDDKGGWWGVV